MFSDFAVWYLFFAGTAAGSFMIAAALDYFGNSFANMRFVSLASRVGFCGAPVLLGIAALMLFLDLGNPAAIVFTFLNPACFDRRMAYRSCACRFFNGCRVAAFAGSLPLLSPS